MESDSLIGRIDAFLAEKGISASAFGREAIGDPNLVRDLRAGREPKRRLIEKIDAYMRENRPRPLLEQSEAHQ